jgi:hypothetical protein
MECKSFLHNLESSKNIKALLCRGAGVAHQRFLHRLSEIIAANRFSAA